MVTEVAILKIDPEKAEAFEKMYSKVVPVLRRQDGYISDELSRAIERPEEYILRVEWENVESHQKFIDSSDYPQMSGPFGEYVLDAGFAHYNTVAKSLLV